MKTNFNSATHTKWFRVCTLLFFTLILGIAASAQAPQITCPPINQRLDCNPTESELTDGFNYYFPPSSGGCSVLTGSFSVGPITTLGCERQTVVTYTVTDDCGNSASCTQLFFWYVDVTPPQITDCSTINLGSNPAVPDCDNQPHPPATDGGCSYMDFDCYANAVLNEGGYDRSRIIQWVVHDACGHIDICEKTYLWTEGVPEITCLPALHIEGCNPSEATLDNAWNTLQPSSEGCSPLNQSVTLGGVSVVGCLRTKINTYTVTDDCGGSASCTRTFTWTVDNTPPQFTCAPGYDLGCNPVVPACSNQAQPNATDLCGAVSYSCTNGAVSSTSTYGRSRAITWTALDDCGNSSTCSKTFTWKESPPIIVDAGPNKIVYKGYPDSACTILQSAISGGAGLLSRQWSTAGNSNLGNTQSISVCPITTRVYYLTVTDGIGCNKTDSVKVCVIDVRCGTNNKSVLICHGTGSATNPYVTLCVGKTEGNSHFLNHPGEQLGPCGMVKTCNWPAQERLEPGGLQEGVEYLGAFPNPFSGSTTVRFMLPEDDFVNVKVFDVAGREMEKLFAGETEAGNIYDVTFDGSRFANGIYFLLLNTQSGTNQTRKLILNK